MAEEEDAVLSWQVEYGAIHHHHSGVPMNGNEQQMQTGITPSNGEL